MKLNVILVVLTGLLINLGKFDLSKTGDRSNCRFKEALTAEMVKYGKILKFS